MKIVHAIGWYYPENLGGTEIYVAGLCRRLRQAGQDVYVAAPQAGRESTSDYLHEGTRVFRYPIPAAASRDEAQGSAVVRGAELFHRWLAGLRPNVLHVHSLVTGLGLFELRVARCLGIPIVLTHHLPSLGYVCRMGTLMERGVAPCDGIASPGRCASCVLVSRGSPVVIARAASMLPRPLSAMLGAIPGPLGTGLGMTASLARDGARQRELADLVDYQVVLNECGMRIVRESGVPANRIILNRLGTDHESVVRKPSVGEAPTAPPIRIGYLGRIDGAKGVRELLLAVRSLPGDLRFTLEVVGPMQSATQPRLPQELYKIAEGDPRVTFSPAVASVDVPAVLARFDVLCCPSTGFENGPTVALEAMAVGTPVIGSRIGNLAELVNDDVNGRLVAPGDIQALAAVLREAASDPRNTIDRWRAGLGAVRSLDEIADDYLALYSSLEVRRARAS